MHLVPVATATVVCVCVCVAITHYYTWLSCSYMFMNMTAIKQKTSSLFNIHASERRMKWSRRSDISTVQLCHYLYSSSFCWITYKWHFFGMDLWMMWSIANRSFCWKRWNVSLLPSFSYLFRHSSFSIEALCMSISMLNDLFQSSLVYDVSSFNHSSTPTFAMIH